MKLFRILLALLLAAWISTGWAAPTGETARLGLYMKIARDLNRPAVLAALEVWTDELTRKFNVPAEVHFYSDVEALRHDFDSGKVNFVIADAMSFVGHFRPEDLAEGFAAKLNTDASLLLLAQPALGGRADLAGKRVAVVWDDDISLTYLDTLCLRQHGNRCDKVVAAIVPVANNHLAITKLFFKQVDMALVNRHGFDTAVELNPQLAGAGDVVSNLTFMTQYFGFFSSRVDPAFRHRALEAVPTLHLGPRGRQLMNVFRADRLVLADPSVLIPFYNLEHEHQALLVEQGLKRDNR